MKGQPPLTIGRAVALGLIALVVIILCVTVPLWYV